VTAERLTAQLLAGPYGQDPVAVVEHLLAVQAQDARGARLAIRARTSGLVAGDVDRSLTADRSLLISWLNRGTLHLVSRGDYPWLHALTTPQLFTGNARRLAQEGVMPDAAERAVTVIERSLARDGALTRTQLRERLDRAGVRTAGQALVHLLMLACLRGLTVRGPMVDGQHAYVLVRDWLGQPKAVPRESALAELARRYLTGHSPADERDLARWAGLPLRDARAGLKAISAELEVRADGLVSLASRSPVSRLAPPRLLGAFDPLLMGWRSREQILGEYESRVVSGGMFRPIALVRGRAAATWSLSGGRVVLEPFARMGRAAGAALEVDAADVVRFLEREPGRETHDIFAAFTTRLR